MKYYIAEIEEASGEREHSSLIRIKSESLEIAQDTHTYWASHWYSEDEFEPCIPDETDTYYYCCDEVAVKEGWLREISESTYNELTGIIVDMTLTEVTLWTWRSQNDR